MIFEPLILDAVAGPLWDDFQTGRDLPTAVPPTLEHWHRSKSLGADANGINPEDVLTRGSELSLRRERLEALLMCGAPALERASSAAAEQDYCLVLSDPDGVIVHFDAGGQFGDTAYRSRLMLGADWSEASRGTNAIGTALATKRPVFVVGGAHYARANHQLVCYAAPIVDARGELVAVLDVTSNCRRANVAMGMGIVATAQALQELLRLQAYSQAGVTVTRALARSLERMDCPVAVIEAPGHVLRMNRPARALLGTASSQGAQGVFGADFSRLAKLASQGLCARVVSPTTGGAYSVRLEPIEGEGTLLALLAFFEPERQLRRVPRTPPGYSAARGSFSEVFCEDRDVQKALSRAAVVAKSSVPIMLLAETGAGKELVARGIHKASPRAAKPFVAINCGAIAPSLLESELFGYGAGAFTGAERGGRTGLLESANGGTLFLDEVAEMSLAMQAALLRFLELGTFFRVGESRSRIANVRVVCATCKDLASLVQRGAFRSDLYYRLKGATVTIPPLRERSDVVALAEHLLAQLAARNGRTEPALAPCAAEALRAFAWPGNVRELRSALEVALVLAGDATAIERCHLPEELAQGAETCTTLGGSKLASQSLARIKEGQIRAVLEDVGGNVSRAAARLGVARSTLYRMMRRYGLR